MLCCIKVVLGGYDFDFLCDLFVKDVLKWLIDLLGVGVKIVLLVLLFNYVCLVFLVDIYVYCVSICVGVILCMGE